MSDSALVVMARFPEKGKIKTRLAQSIGDENTQRLYHAFLTDIAQKFADGDCDLSWAYTPAGVDFERFIALLTRLDAARCRSFPQQGAELGARLHAVFQTMYARHLQKTIVIASDSPHISRGVISQAREALNSTDVVLGPADDGGYYLIAMSEPHDVFSNIPMSTQDVLRMTIDKAHDQGLSVQLLEPLFDVDELPELVRLAHLLEREQALAPATAACLAQIIPAYSMKEIV
jgi:rSAM/selenodomain-associated transferase 1